MSEVQLTYGKDSEGRLRHISVVPNGLNCACTCPGCGAPLIAKNQGATVHPHFAHASGCACSGAHESELHLLAKEILATEKSVMLPPYGHIYEGGLQRFASMEVEERNDYSMLQPDVVGVQKDYGTGRTSRLWIEIRVTHEVGPDKYEKIKALGVSCLEIDLSLYQDLEVNRDTVRDFLLKSKDYRHWINNPILEQRMMLIKEQRRLYAESMRNNYKQQSDTDGTVFVHEDDCETDDLVLREKCSRCPNHSCREAISREVTLQKLPSSIQKILLRYPLQWMSNPLISPLPTRATDSVVTIGRDTIYLPTSNPDVYGNVITQARLNQNQRAIAFFNHTLPHLVNTLGTKCDYIEGYKETNKGLCVHCGYKKQKSAD